MKEQWQIEYEQWMREEQCDSYGESAFWDMMQPTRNVIDVHMPKRLYKYVKCDDFSIRTLKEGFVGLTSAIRFNDPFDTLQRLDPGLLKKVYVGRGIVDPDKDPVYGRDISYMQTSQQWTQGSMYVSCFSESVVNMLMWSHYACSHCGFAIGYEFDEGVNAENRKYLFPVIYSDKKYDASWGVYELVSDLHFGDLNYVRN